MKRLKTIFACMLMALFSIGQMWGGTATETIKMKGFASITATGYQNITKSGTSDENSLGMVAYAYIGSSGQVRGNKTSIAGASVTSADNTKNWSLYNSDAMPGAITAIKVTGSVTGTNKFQNKLFVSLGTSSQGAVTSVDDAQEQDAGATATEINFTIDATKGYTYFKLLSNQAFTSGAVTDVKVEVTYSTGGAPTPTLSLTPTTVSVGSTDVASQTIGLTANNFTTTVNDVTCAFFNAAECNVGDAISQPAWITNLADNNSNQVTFNISDNEGEERHVWMKITASNSSSQSASAILPISQAAYVAPFDGLELTFPDEGSDGSNVASYTTEWTATKGTQSWSIYGFNTNKWGWNPAVIKTGRKNNSGTAQPLTATIETQVTDHAVGDIVVTVDAVTAAQITSHKLYVADNSSFDGAIEIDGDPANIAAGNITYTVPVANRANDLYYKLEYATAGTGSSNGILTISKITYAYATAAPQKQSTGLAYADELKNHLVKVGASYDAPELTNPDHLTGITYASSADAIVEVNETTGALTIKEAGKAVITASRAEDETYKAGSASYTIYVATEAGTAADPLSEASAKSLIDLGCTMEAHVHGVVQGEQDATKFTVTLAGGMQFYKLKDLGNVAFESAYIGNGDEVTAVGSLLKYNNSIYELAEGCYLTAYTEYTEPVVTLKQSGSTVTVLNLDATSVANQAIDVEYTNFADAISSVSTVLYEESTCETEITSGAWVTDITVNGAKDQVTFNVADNAGEARQVWLKVTASDGTNEAYAVLAILQAKYTVDYAELPFAFDGGRADIATTNGITQEGLGTDYNSSPKLKFDGTGDYVIIKINDDPGTLSYEIKGNSFSGSTFTVQQSEDGVTYSDLATYTELSSDKQSESKDLDQETRFVKFIYTEKVQNGGNVALGNIGITAYVAPAVKPTITTQPEGAEYTQGYTPEALTIVAEAAIGGNLSYQWYSNDENTTEGAVAIEGADEAEYTPSTASIATTYYYCVVTEEGADEPTTSNIVAIAVSAAPEPTGTFELFSGDLVAGEFVICSGTNAMKNEVTTSPRIDVATVTISENKIQDPDASIIWKIEALTGDDAGKWTIYNEAKGVYAAFNTTDGRGVLLDEVTDFAKWTTESAYDFINVGKTSKNYLRYNPTFGFASYATTTGETLTLYMKPDGKQNAGLAYADANHLVKVGAEYTAPTLTNPNELTVSYASSDADIVAVDASTGALTIKASGKAVITASFAGNDEYRKGSASYTIYVAAQAGTAADPLSEASAVALIDLGCEMNAHVHGTVASQDGTYYTITLSDGFKFWSVKDLGNVDFETAYLKVGDEVTAYGQLAKYGSTYELATGCYLTAYTEYKEPAVSLKRSGSVVTALNVAATDVVDQEIDIECTNFADAISSVTAELYEESTCDTKITSGAWVTDITVNGTSQVIFNVADNDGDARQVWLKVTAGDGTSEASAVLTISQAKYIADYATLPFAFDGVKADIANTGGMTQSGLGSDYTGSNVTTKLKFDNTGDNLIIHINEAPDRLTYDIKGNSFSGGTFKVQESEDGETYSDLATYTEDGTSVEHQLASTTRYIKFVYVEKSSGNIGLGNIAISKYVAPEPPVEPEWTNGVRTDLNEGWYYTMCLDKAVTEVRGASIWRVLSKAENGLDIILEEVTGTLDAGRPYIFFATAASLDVIYTGDAVGAPITTGNNGLVGSFSQEEITQSSNNYILYNNAMYYVNSLAYVGANRAYLDMTGVPAYDNDEPQVGNVQGRRRVVMNVYNGNQMPTGIEGIEVSEAPRKVMIDGQLFILRDKKMYDASGRLVK